jgi:hypothetical protein
MNGQEIIEMARQVLSKDIDGLWLAGTPDLEAFAKLVYDRRWMNGYTSCDNDNKTLTSVLIADAVEEEREACAKVCEEQYEYYGHDHVFAKAIRARV